MGWRILGLALLTAFLSNASGCTTAPVLNPDRSFPNESVSDNKLEVGIRAAAEQTGWQLRRVTSHRFLATRIVKLHEARALIVFDDDSYQITHIGSRNLKASGGRIHKTYNLWVQNLDRAIAEEFGINP